METTQAKPLPRLDGNLRWNPGGTYFLSNRQGFLTLNYSHSIVPGGLLVISSTTRFTPFTSFTMRLEMVSIRS